VGFSLPAPEKLMNEFSFKKKKKKLMNEHLTCWLLRYLRSSSALQGQGDDGFFFELKLFFSGMKKSGSAPCCSSLLLCLRVVHNLPEFTLDF
jgi:hypothetical protein